DCRDDLCVAGAAAEVAGQCLSDLITRRERVSFQQRPRSQQHARRAVAALGSAELGERLLERVQLRGAAHPFHSRDLAVVELDREEEAAQLWLAVDQDGTGAALAQLATVLRPAQPQVFTPNP